MSIRRMAGIAATTTALALLVAACGGGGSAAAVSPPPGTETTVDAQGMQFTEQEVSVPANAGFKLFFRNLDGAPHNVAIYRDESATAAIFVGDRITDAAVTYDVPALEPGSYFFRCDVHPDMTGTVVAG